eukprot:CAMPEP_0204384482 /NCGR_PEP_ID=MMETSP0469-20131031/56906_1 /ASSEMBLY_ACC=CAM_ASM_000384 /TAXON_ID=2969 /ORGANISM="Oxyrrhis marina" /LENGTH=66 /DNA_ID=CAMNT_0051377117 /DNA_START=11 /DNA_END=208 /DNA_ORIENTATION=+
MKGLPAVADAAALTLQTAESPIHAFVVLRSHSDPEQAGTAAAGQQSRAAFEAVQQVAQILRSPKAQ